MDLISEIKKDTTKAIKKLWPDFDFSDIGLTVPNNTEFGDYSTGIALAIAKQLKAKPLEIAEQLKAAIGKVKAIGEITVTAPGFVNFVIDYPLLAAEILASKAKFSGGKPVNISIEHTSVNPNKAAHIGHLRNACLGDSLGRILRGLGNTIEIQNYIDDLGLQVADSVVAYETFGDAPDDWEIDKWLWKIYSDINKKYETHPELKERRDAVLHEMERGESETAKAIVERIVPAQLKTFERFGIKYDLLTYEHDVVNNHLWEKLFEVLQEKRLIHKPIEGPHAGAWIVEYGESEREDKILVRSNGILTYTGKDLPLALWKFGKTDEMVGYSKRLLPIFAHINVIDERQSYPQAVIKHVMEELGYKKEAEHYKHLGYGTVKLSAGAMKQLGLDMDLEDDGKSAYAMSGRAGIGVMIDDLFTAVVAKQMQDHPETTPEAAEKIAVGSIRYYMLKNRPDREIVFDFDEALKTDGNTGVYVQYAYARANNILEKLSKTNTATQIPEELNESETRLIKTMSEAEGVVMSAAEKCDPSLVCDYIYSLASSFAKFYEASPVMKAETETQKTFRTNLVTSYRDLLGAMLEMVGVPSLPKF